MSNIAHSASYAPYTYILLESFRCGPLDWKFTAIKREVLVSREAKVRDLGRAVFSDKNVSRCQISMYDVPGLQIRHTSTRIANHEFFIN